MSQNVLFSCIQSLTFIITSIYLLCNTTYTIPYFFGFTSLTLSVLSLQLLVGLYERGPYKDDYDGIMKVLNEDFMLSGFSLLAGLFINAFIETNNFGCLALLLLFSYLTKKLTWYFSIQLQ